MKLQLGFESIPYSLRYTRFAPLPRFIRQRKPKKLSPAQTGYGMGKTTGMVSEELEKKYGIVGKFYELEEDFVVDNFEVAFKSAMEVGMTGGPWDAIWNPIQLEGKFRRGLSNRRFDNLISGVPTRAAQRGVSHLRKDPFAPRASRPSFVDTSLYQRSFKAWTEK